VVEEVTNKFKEKVVEKIELIIVPMGWKSRAWAVDDSVPKGWKPRFVKCDVCGKTLARNKDLMQRMRVHEGTKYGCDKCDPGYRRGEEMEKHRRERHEKAGSWKWCIFVVCVNNIELNTPFIMCMHFFFSLKLFTTFVTGNHSKKEIVKFKEVLEEESKACTRHI
jgi:hypothetical protein